MAHKLKNKINIGQIPGLVKSGFVSLPKFFLIDHLVVFIRVLIALLLVLAVYLAVQVLLTPSDPLLAIEAEIKQLDKNRLEKVITTLDARRAELPETIVGNRREFLVRP